MAEALTDAAIVRGLRAGDRSAWEALCDQYSARVWRYVARLIGDTDAVADVYQETMLAVAKSGRSLTENAKLWAWLAAIGHNQTALYWRKRYRHRTSSLGCAEVESTSFDDPAEAFSRAETITTVRCLLAEMNSDHATLLAAKYLDDMSVPQIVDEWGETREAIRSRLARARQDFRKRYERLVTRVISDER